MVSTHEHDHHGNGVQAPGLSVRLRLGRNVLLLLAVLTALEFWIAVDWSRNALIPSLVVIVLIKAWLIVQYFMHVKQLWRAEE